MSLCPNALLTEVGCLNHQHALPATAFLSKCGDSPLELEGDEDEDEDVDFNPFLKETPSLEASSSLSSEVEGLDADVESGGNSSVSMAYNLSSKITGEMQDCAIGDSEHGEEEIVTQGMVSPDRACEKELGKTVPGKPKKGTPVLTSQPEIETICEKENGSSSGTDVVNDGLVGELNNTIDSGKPIMVLDDNDAICMRTRARYSLAGFTLDELETFLQETDDEDDFQNVDDEEEYRKFLAAVLQGVDGDDQTIQESENVDEEDEDNDADFQIEIEEALESDLDENTRGETHKEEYEAAGRRPETRQNRRQKASVQNQKKVLEQAKRPLRPLLPIMPNAPIAPFPVLDGNYLMSETAPHYLSSTARDGFLNGFTSHQIGQLHCLIHEHVQLLIQVFSLCVLEPSRQHIASQVQGLISEMLNKRDQVLAWRSMPYPSFCFHPPYIHPSVTDELPKICPAQFTFESPPISDAQQGCSSTNNKMPLSDNVSSSNVIYEYISNGQVSSFQTTEGTFWVPYISGPILSVLDVAPLNLVGRYMDDVSTAKREYQRRHLEVTCDTRFEREPLFPLPSFPSFAEANSEVVRGTIPPSTNIGPSSSPCNRPPKKTLAAALVESTKKQSVALVAKEIVKLAQRFFSLFNPALYPHKPPPVPVANRVLFTDAEDELLALGLMEYNTDWKAIQQRFLPCKSKHQIFVRQKNRCSSKAPENPIKAVRRMKTSPLTAEEIARIHEGLRVFKLDWMSICKFIVPYRDPSLLPRQWRIALGTQKSYKTNSAKKEKRRLYESNRRRCKAAALSSWQTASEKEDNQIENDGRENDSGDDCIDNEDEAYVHEAFLADWRPGTSSLVSSEPPFSNLREKSQSSGLLSQGHVHLREQTNNNGSGESQRQNGYVHEFLAATDSHHLHTLSPVLHTHVRHFASYAMEPNHPVYDLNSKSSKSQFCSRPYRVRRTSSAHLVKLAPDLPPVNLPPSVRVISQSAFKSYQGGTSTKFSAAAGGGGSGGAGTESLVPRLSHATKSGASHSRKARQNGINALKYDIANLHLQESGVLMDRCAGEERGTDADLLMHPLLFQAPKDGHLPYYPLNCSTGTPTSFSFSAGNQPQLNLSLFHNSHQANPTVSYSNKPLKSKESSLTSCGIDFHPLLQRPDDVNGASATGGPTAQLSVNLESCRGACAQIGSSSVVFTEPQASGRQPAARDKPFSPNEKSNELDLEIHLSSTMSRKEKAMGNRDEHNPTRSTVSAPNSRTTMETQNASSPYFQDGETCPVTSMLNGIHGEHVSGACAMSIPGNNISRCSIDNINDQSLPGIVMEQEELSDSDEEVGEHVEFECEEMADSEGEEGSDCDQMGNIQNKEAPDVEVERVVTDPDVDDRQGEPNIHGYNPGNVCVPLKCSIPKLGLTGQGKETSSSLSLNIKTSRPGWLAPEKSRDGPGPTGKNVAASRLKRSCKKTKSSMQNVAMQKRAVDMPQQHDLVSLAATPLRKPRKRACRIDSSFKKGLTAESSSCVSNDKIG